MCIWYTICYAMSYHAMAWLTYHTTPHHITPHHHTIPHTTPHHTTPHQHQHQHHHTTRHTTPLQNHTIQHNTTQHTTQHTIPWWIIFVVMQNRKRKYTSFYQSKATPLLQVGYGCVITRHPSCGNDLSMPCSQLWFCSALIHIRQKLSAQRSQTVVGYSKYVLLKVKLKNRLIVKPHEI